MCKQRLPPIHPGEILGKEFIQLLNISANALAQRLGVTTTRVNEIANERRGIMAGTALRLTRCFSTTPEFWMNLQQRHELEAARRAVGSAVERKIDTLKLAEWNLHPFDMR